MKRLTVLFCLFASFPVFSQTATTSENKSQALPERFNAMKSNSQTFKEYKVIKEVVLDAEWKIFQDTVKAMRASSRAQKTNIAQLEIKRDSLQTAIRQREESVAKIEHAATHIDFFGIDFNKAVFVITVIIAIGSVLAMLALVTGRLKIMFNAMREKNETVDRITLEFEEYKHKALEKQSKLSRELQNERNKLQELRRPA